jgi:hypothetical protein
MAATFAFGGRCASVPESGLGRVDLLSLTGSLPIDTLERPRRYTDRGFFFHGVFFFG